MRNSTMRITVLFGLILSLPTVVLAETISPTRENNLQHMADVARTTILNLPNQSARLFSYTAGDPSSNGLLLNLAVMNEQYEWNVYPLKNVADYQILPSAKVGYLKLSLHTDDHLDELGNIRSSPSTMFINLTQAHRVNGKIEIEEIKSK